MDRRIKSGGDDQKHIERRTGAHRAPVWFSVIAELPVHPPCPVMAMMVPPVMAVQMMPPRPELADAARAVIGVDDAAEPARAIVAWAVIRRRVVARSVIAVDARADMVPAEAVMSIAVVTRTEVAVADKARAAVEMPLMKHRSAPDMADAAIAAVERRPATPEAADRADARCAADMTASETTATADVAAMEAAAPDMTTAAEAATAADMAAFVLHGDDGGRGRACGPVAGLAGDSACARGAVAIEKLRAATATTANEPIRLVRVGRVGRSGRCGVRAIAGAVIGAPPAPSRGALTSWLCRSRAQARRRDVNAP